MTDPPAIVPAEPHDFQDLAALDRTAWAGTSNGEFIPDGEHTWRIWCEFALVFLAKDRAGRLLGAVLACPCLGAPMCLHKLLVDESQRGKGLGGLLMERILEELDRRGDACFLTVSPANDAALRLYRRCGFFEERFVPGFYKPSEDRLVMRRNPVASGLLPALSSRQRETHED